MKTCGLCGDHSAATIKVCRYCADKHQELIDRNEDLEQDLEYKKMGRKNDRVEINKLKKQRDAYANALETISPQAKAQVDKEVL